MVCQTAACTSCCHVPCPQVARVLNNVTWQPLLECHHGTPVDEPPGVAVYQEVEEQQRRVPLLPVQVGVGVCTRADPAATAKQAVRQGCDCQHRCMKASGRAQWDGYCCFLAYSAAMSAVGAQGVDAGMRTAAAGAQGVDVPHMQALTVCCLCCCCCCPCSARSSSSSQQSRCEHGTWCVPCQ